MPSTKNNSINSRNRSGQLTESGGDSLSAQGRSVIADSVESSINQFLDDLNGEEVKDIYNMVMHQVEKPLLEVVMKYCEDNQSKASRVLGINRNTLRKKLADHKIGPNDKAGI